MSAAPQQIELPIGGMTCASCASRIERKLNKLDGVSATVNYATEKARVDFDADAVAPEAARRRGRGGRLHGAPCRTAATADERGPRRPTRRGRCASAADRLGAALAAGRCSCR